MAASPASASSDRTSAATLGPAGERLVGVALAVAGVFCFSIRPVLIKLAYAYEQGTRLRRVPQFRPVTP